MVEDASCVGRRLPLLRRPSGEELGRGSGGIAQLVERRPCNWVVVFAGWMLSLLSGNDSIVYPNQWLTFSQKWVRGLEHAIQDCASCLLCPLPAFGPALRALLLEGIGRSREDPEDVCPLGP